MKINKTFIACPISKYLTNDGIDKNFEEFIKEIYAFIKTISKNVFLALEREEYGKNKMYGSDCTISDYKEMLNADLLIAIPEDSMGVSVEIGWASALKIKTIVIVDKKYRQSELVKSINSIVDGKRIDIDTTNGLKNEIEKIKIEIKKYIDENI